MTKSVKAILFFNVLFFLINLLLDSFGLTIINLMSLNSFDNPNFSWFGFLTYMFSHQGFSHLFMNMSFFVFFGNRLESKIGSEKLTSIFLISGILGGLAHITTFNSSIIGSSAAVWGILGVSVLEFGNENIAKTIPIKTWAFIGFFFLLEVLLLEVQDGVSHIAHVMGAISGIVAYKTYE